MNPPSAAPTTKAEERVWGAAGPRSHGWLTGSGGLSPAPRDKNPHHIGPPHDCPLGWQPQRRGQGLAGPVQTGAEGWQGGVGKVQRDPAQSAPLPQAGWLETSSSAHITSDLPARSEGPAQITLAPPTEFGLQHYVTAAKPHVTHQHP